MKKVLLTLMFGLFFVAFSSAQSTETKKAKSDFTVKQDKTTSDAKAKACCGGAKASCTGKKVSCDGAKKASCTGKDKAACAGKNKAACDAKAKASCGSAKSKKASCGSGKCGGGK